ncbi:hypothetical protein Hanom_Chr06g00573101 [Helianthus anomalus]
MQVPSNHFHSFLLLIKFSNTHLVNISLVPLTFTHSIKKILKIKYQEKEKRSVSP